MITQVREVVPESGVARQWERGERLAGVTVSRNWVRKHFGDLTGRALQQARKDPVFQTERSARWMNRESEARWAAR